MKFFTITTRTRKRLRHHLFIAAAGFVLTGLIYVVLLQFYPEPERWIFRWSLTTGYIASLLLAATLTLGAWKILRGRVVAVSTDLRRDIGIWCGIFSLAHVAFGLNVHMKSWMLYFVTDAGGLRIDLFGFANYLGAAATILVVVLLATSNDFSLTQFGRERWKAIQRWNYFFAFLIALHGFFYIAIEKRIVPFAFIFGAVALWTVMIQFAGAGKRRRETRSALNSATQN